MSMNTLDPINSATFGLATDLCIKSISSNSDPNFLETTILSRCDGDDASSLVIFSVSTSGATLNRQFTLASTTIDKICTAAGNKYVAWDSSKNSLTQFENHISVYQNSLDLSIYDTESAQIKNLECLGELDYFLLSLYYSQQNSY